MGHKWELLSPDIAEAIVGGGPSKDWQSFPGRVMANVQRVGMNMHAGGDAILAAKSPEELAAAVNRYSATQSQLPGAKPPLIPVAGTPYRILNIGPPTDSLSNARVHGVTLPDFKGTFGTMQNAIAKMIQEKAAFFQNLPDLIRSATAKLQAQQAAAQPPANLGGPVPPSGSTTPGVNSALTAPARPAVPVGSLGSVPGGSLNLGVNSGLTAEQQRALMFKVA